MPWTYERIEKLKQLWEEGLTASRIAIELGEVTRNAVIGKAHRLGLSGRMSAKSSKGGVSIIRKRKVHAKRDQKVIDITPQIDEPMNPVEFNEIKDGLCRWPLGEPEDTNFRFCGRNTNEGFVYCKSHHNQAYQPLSKIRERKKVKRKFRIS